MNTEEQRRRPRWRRRRTHRRRRHSSVDDDGDGGVYNRLHSSTSFVYADVDDDGDGSVNANRTSLVDTDHHHHRVVVSSSSSRDFECYRRVNGGESQVCRASTSSTRARRQQRHSNTTSSTSTSATKATAAVVLLERVAKFIWINVMKLTLNMCRRTFRSIFDAVLHFGRRQKSGFRRCLATSASSPNMYTPVTTFVLFASTVLRLADACSSRSTPKPRTPSPTIRPNITFPTSVCPPNYDTWYCLNGATCFTVEISESVLYNCVCADGYTGPRCEFKDLDGSYLPSRDRIMVERASIAGGVTVAVLLIVIISIAFYIYSRRRKKERNLTVTDGIDVRPRHFRSHRLSQQGGHCVRQCRSIYHQDLESGDGNLRRDLADDLRQSTTDTALEDTELSASPSQRIGDP